MRALTSDPTLPATGTGETVKFEISPEAVAAAFARGADTSFGGEPASTTVRPRYALAQATQMMGGRSWRRFVLDEGEPSVVVTESIDVPFDVGVDLAMNVDRATATDSDAHKDGPWTVTRARPRRRSRLAVALVAAALALMLAFAAFFEEHVADLAARLVPTAAAAGARSPRLDTPENAREIVASTPVALRPRQVASTPVALRPRQETTPSTLDRATPPSPMARNATAKTHSNHVLAGPARPTSTLRVQAGRMLPSRPVAVKP